jgi:hypothetical protein
MTIQNPLRLQHRRPPFDRSKGDSVSGTFAFAVSRAHERARQTGVRQLVTLSPYGHPDLTDAPGAWWRIQAQR